MQRMEFNFRCFYKPLYYFLRLDISMNFQLTKLTRLNGQGTPETFYCCLSSTELSAWSAMPGFFHGCWKSQLGFSCLDAVAYLLTDPSPQPHLCIVSNFQLSGNLAQSKFMRITAQRMVISLFYTCILVKKNINRISFLHSLLSIKIGSSSVL